MGALRPVMVPVKIGESKTKEYPGYEVVDGKEAGQ
jgi:hypothetical protein